MGMPETAMHEEGDPARGQHDVGRTRQVAPMKPEALAEAVEERADASPSLDLEFFSLDISAIKLEQIREFDVINIR